MVDGTPTTGIRTVLDEPYSAIFVIFDITDGELGFGTVVDKADYRMKGLQDERLAQEKVGLIFGYFHLKKKV